MITEQEVVYYASEAGSPIVSDPAYPLIQACIKRKIPIDSFSGVSSLIMALELCGLPPAPFMFHAFLPRQRQKLKDLVMLILQVEGTHLFFESPNRIIDSVEYLLTKIPDASFAMVRELTKKFQQSYHFDSRNWPEIKASLVLKGEFVLGVHHKIKGHTYDPELVNMAKEIVDSGAKDKLVAKLVAKVLNQPVKDVYKQLTN